MFNLENLDELKIEPVKKSIHYVNHNDKIIKYFNFKKIEIEFPELYYDIKKNNHNDQYRLLLNVDETDKVNDSEIIKKIKSAIDIIYKKLIECVCEYKYLIVGKK